MAWRSLLMGFAAFLALEFGLFRSGLYFDWLEPASSAGTFELTLMRERRRQEFPGNLVLTLGDSRFAYLPRLANQFSTSTGYSFSHAGVAGTNPRVWYFMLRDLDSTASRYKAIVFGVNDYFDEDTYVDMLDATSDIHYVGARLRLSDLSFFPQSYGTPATRYDAFKKTFFKGLIVQEDLKQFIENPLKRIKDVPFIKGGWPGWTYDYEEEVRSLSGLSIDWTRMEATLPPDADPQLLTILRTTLLRPVAPQTGTIAAYRKFWFNRLLQRYVNSTTKIIFLRLPRGPLVRPPQLFQPTSWSIKDLRQYSNVSLLPESTFDSIERPEYFKDPLQLNRKGAELFSHQLATEIAKTLGPPRP